jgi:hypothetical protein
LFYNLKEIIIITLFKLHILKKDKKEHVLKSYFILNKNNIITKYHCSCGHLLNKSDVPSEYLTYLGITSDKNSINFVVSD